MTWINNRIIKYSDDEELFSSYQESYRESLEKNLENLEFLKKRNKDSQKAKICTTQAAE